MLLPHICHDLVVTDIDYLSITQSLTLIHCIDDLMLNGLGEQEK